MSTTFQEPVLCHGQIGRTKRSILYLVNNASKFRNQTGLQ